MRTATYVVQLKSAEKQTLEAMLKKGRQSAREPRRARVLLLCREKHQGNPGCDRHERSRHPECEEWCFTPVSVKPGRKRREDDAYVREDHCALFMLFESQRQFRHVEVRPRRSTSALSRPRHAA